MVSDVPRLVLAPATDSQVGGGLAAKMPKSTRSTARNDRSPTARSSAGHPVDLSVCHSHLGLSRLSITRRRVLAWSKEKEYIEAEFAWKSVA
jgi:hypothetical protein